MNTKILLLVQLASFILMIGTAERLFSSLTATIIFIIAIATFAKSSVYINKNEKWLLRENGRE